MSRRETLEKFVEKAREVHGDKYDYSLVELNGNNKKVQIICPTHGIFLKSPAHHKDGQGCKKCSFEIKNNNSKELYSEYIKSVKLLHSDKFEYAEINNQYRPANIDLKCPVHGWINMDAYAHKAGAGCFRCAVDARAENKRDNIEDFIKKSKVVHGDKYSYSKVDLVNDTTKITVVCKAHGDFDIMPYAHKQGVGCKECGEIAKSVKQLDSLEQLLSKFKMAHGDYYDYTLITENLGDKYTVKIICPLHGEFSQLAGAHKVGKGCASCGISGYDQKKSGIFYILRAGNLTKVGITNRKVTDRVRSINRTSGEDFKIHTSITSKDGSYIYSTEQKVLKFLKSHYQNVDRRFDGFTECFVDVDIDKLLEFISNK